MRVGLLLLASLLVAAVPAQADPIAFTFTGTLNQFSSLTRADGTLVDLSFAPFTVTGVTTGLSALWRPDQSWSTRVAAFSATSVWDFGIYGTALSIKDYVEYFDPTNHQLFSIALDDWSPARLMFLGADLRGLQVYFDPRSVPVTNPTAPTPLGQLAQYTGGPTAETFALPTTDNGTIVDKFTGYQGAQGSVTSVRIDPVSEPATLLLVGLGAAGAVLRSRRRLHH
jgi:hypothetical protein